MAVVEVIREATWGDLHAEWGLHLSHIRQMGKSRFELWIHFNEENGAMLYAGSFRLWAILLFRLIMCGGAHR